MYLQYTENIAFLKFFITFYLFIFSVCMCMCAHASTYMKVYAHECQSTYVEVRGQLSEIGSLLLLCGFWGLNLDHQI